MSFSEEQIKKVGKLLINTNRPLKERFRALFTLKNIGGILAIECIAKAFDDESALLKHEVAYCLGQLQDPTAIPILSHVLEDRSREAIVRHEAAEALGAIGTTEVLPILQKYSKDSIPEVSDTCKMAIDRLNWLAEGGKDDKNLFTSVDPAPPLMETDTKALKMILLDETLPMFERYRAMFSLRNNGDDASIQVLALGLQCSSALFRHEVAFVLGQAASPAAINELITRLRDADENPMVRHECAEALGGIGAIGVEQELSKYLGKEEADVVRESCVVALDMVDYNNSEEFQYANALSG
jgi:deoxyhypusine monooxygenase